MPHPRFLSWSVFAVVLACQARPQPLADAVAPASVSAPAPALQAAAAKRTELDPSAHEPPQAEDGFSLVPDPPKQCGPCEEWNAPREPFRLYGNSYYVGTAGLSAVLVVGNAGAILLDGGLSQSAPLIAENIQKLGFRVQDVRVIVNSHTHYDHAGGISALQRASKARVLASPAAQRALLKGQPTRDDPQFGFGAKANGFPPLPEVHALKDRQVVQVGELALTAHFTPGHTPGGTSWTWRSCEGDRCLNMVYGDSLTAISAPGYHYWSPSNAERRAERFEQSIARIAALPCDILVTTHPGFVQLDDKLANHKLHPDTNPFVDAEACKNYAAHALGGLKQRIAQERGDQATSAQNPH